MLTDVINDLAWLISEFDSDAWKNHVVAQEMGNN
jgi:hypothetical protein